MLQEAITVLVDWKKKKSYSFSCTVIPGVLIRLLCAVGRFPGQTATFHFATGCPSCSLLDSSLL
jgi:hypothetical protein